MNNNTFKVQRPQCEQIPKQECQVVPRQQCNPVERQICDNVPSESCENVAKQDCQQVRPPHYIHTIMINISTNYSFQNNVKQLQY